MGLFELQNIGRFYQISKDKKKYVLKGVTLSFPHRGLITILGKSGSGKSTLLNMIGKSMSQVKELSSLMMKIF